MPRKAGAAEGKAEAPPPSGRPLPIGTRLSLRLPRSELPEDVAKALAAELEEEEPEEAEAGEGRQWCAGTVVRARKRPTAGDSEGGLQHLLRLANGAEFWTEVEKWPCLLHPASREAETEAGPFDDEEDDDATGVGAGSGLRALMAAQLPRGKGKVPVAGQDKESPADLGEPKQQQAWNKEMTVAGSTAELAALVEASLPRFDALNVAAAMHRLSRRAPFAEEEAEAAWAAVRGCAARAAADRLGGYSARGVATMCWALARLGVQVALPDEERDGGAPPRPKAAAEDDEALAASAQGKQNPTLVADAAVVFSLAMEQFTADVAWAATADWEEVSAWTSDWTSGGLWGGWKPQEVANLCWAIGRATGPRAGAGAAGRLLGLVAQGATVCSWKGFSPQELASTLGALLAAGRAPPFLMQRVLSKVRRHRSMFKPFELCLVLSAAARTLSNKSVRPVLSAAVADAVSSELRGFKPIDLACLVGLLGKLHHRSQAAGTKAAKAKSKSMVKTSMPFLSAVVAYAREKEDEWNPPELASLVLGLSQLSLTDDELLDSICSRWRTWLTCTDGATPPPAGAASASQLALLAPGLAQLGRREPELGAAACARLREALKAGEPCSLQHVVGVLWGAACMLALGDTAASEGPTAEEQEQGADSANALLAAGLWALLRTLMAQTKKRGLDLTAPVQLAQLHTVHMALLAFEARGKGGGQPEEEGAAAPWRPSERAAEAWLEASNQQETARAAERSQLCKEVCSLLEEGVLQELYSEGWSIECEAMVEGLHVDILIRPKGRKLSPVSIEFSQQERLRSLSDEEPALGERPRGPRGLRRWLLRRRLGAAAAELTPEAWRGCGQDAEAKRSLLLEALRPAAKKKARRREGAEAAEAAAEGRPRKRPRRGEEE